MMPEHTPNIWRSPRLRSTHRILAQAVILLEFDRTIGRANSCDRRPF